MVLSAILLVPLLPAVLALIEPVRRWIDWITVVAMAATLGLSVSAAADTIAYGQVSAIGGWLVTHSSSGALIVAAIVSVMSAAMAFLMIPPPRPD